MFLNEKWGIAYESSRIYINMFSGFSYPFNDCIYDILIAAIIILLIVNIKAYRNFIMKRDKALEELKKKQEEEEKEESGETVIPAPVTKLDNVSMPKAAAGEDDTGPDNRNINSDGHSEPEENNDTENDFDKTIRDMKERQYEEEREKSEDMIKRQKSLENEQKIDSEIRRKIRKKS